MKIHTVQLNLEDLNAGTFDMDAAEFGAYVRLFLACYQTSDYSLPNDDVRLARIARCSLKVWKRIKPVVVDKFVDKEGRLYHERVVKDAVKYQERSTINQANRLKGLETGQQIVNERSTNGQLPNTYNLESINPIPVTTTEGGSGSFHSEKFDKGAAAPLVAGAFNIDHHLDDKQREKARALAPGWDFYYLMRSFNGFVANQKLTPHSPVGMFMTWLPRFTKNKPPR